MMALTPAKRQSITSMILETSNDEDAMHKNQILKYVSIIYTFFNINQQFIYKANGTKFES